MNDDAECHRQFEAFYCRDIKGGNDCHVPWGHSWVESRWKFWKAAWDAGRTLEASMPQSETEGDAKVSEESTDANNPAQLQHETKMSPEDCDRMERAAERVELANEACRLAGVKIDGLKSRLRYIATAAPSSGEPAWHFIDRIQAVASQADGTEP